MMNRDDFEHRLGQGMKKWAEGGKPTLDLEGYVKNQTGTDTDGETAPEVSVAEPIAEPAPVPARTRTLPRWFRWASPAVAAAAVALVLTFTFPAWAGAASGWPIVGPVVTEIIMKDAGLKWAFDAGLIREAVAEGKDGDVTYRVLGVMADGRRTTVIYQVTGLPAPKPFDGKPIPVHEDSWIPPLHDDMVLQVGIAGVNGVGGWSSSSPPVHTAVGYVGVTSTSALTSDTAEVDVGFRFNGTSHKLTVTATRSETDRFSREVAVNQTQEIDGIKVTVEAVTYTPAETVVRYRVEKPTFWGGVAWDQGTDPRHYMEAGGKRYSTTDGSSGINGLFHDVFPPVKGPVKFVIPMDVKALEVDLQWPLQVGAELDVLGSPAVLREIQRSGGAVHFVWEREGKDRFMGLGHYQVIDSEGKAYSLDQGGWASYSNYRDQEGHSHSMYAAPLPAGVEPVAVKARQIGMAVDGPWVFELPR